MGKIEDSSEEECANAFFFWLVQSLQSTITPKTRSARGYTPGPEEKNKRKTQLMVYGGGVGLEPTETLVPHEFEPGIVTSLPGLHSSQSHPRGQVKRKEARLPTLTPPGRTTQTTGPVRFYQLTGGLPTLPKHPTSPAEPTLNRWNTIVPMRIPKAI